MKQEYRVTKKDLMVLTKEELCAYLEDMLSKLSLLKRRQWIKDNLPELIEINREKLLKNPRQLIEEVDSFVEESHSGIYVSWVNDHDWYNGNEYNEEDYEKFEEWTERCTDFFNRTIETAKAGNYKVKLNVTDNDCWTNEHEITVQVLNRVPIATLEADRTEIYTNEPINFSAQSSTDIDGTLVEYNFEFGDGSSSGWIPTCTHSTSLGVNRSLLTSSCRDSIVGGSRPQ